MPLTNLFGFVFSIFVMIGLPIIAAIWFKRKFGGRWWGFFAGAITFGLTQLVFRIPLVGVLQVLVTKAVDLTQPVYLYIWLIFLSYTAGLVEEWGRFGAYKLLIKDVRDWKGGVLLGLGHGGFESIIAGISLFSTVVIYYAGQAFFPHTMIVQQVAVALNGLPFYMTLLGAFERVAAISMHIALSLVVLSAVRSGRTSIVWVSVMIHGTVNIIAVALNQQVGPVVAEAFMLLVLIACIFYILSRKEDDVTSEPVAEHEEIQDDTVQP